MSKYEKEITYRKLEEYSDSIVGSNKRIYYFAGGKVIAINAENALRQIRERYKR